MKNLSVDKLRDSMWNESYRLEEGGWHWSYFGGVERFKEKMVAGADAQQAAVDDAIDRVEGKQDPLGRGKVYQPIPIDVSFPEYIRNNQDKYAEFIKAWN